MPPMPEPRMTPTRSRSIEFRSSPALRIASAVATTANWTKRFMRFASLRSSTPSVVKSLTSQAKRVPYPVVSNRVIGPAPEQPATSRRQNCSPSLPSGETIPRPVTSTRCGAGFTVRALLSTIPDDRAAEHSSPARSPRKTLGFALRRRRVRAQVIHRVAYRLELVGVLVRDLEPELLFQLHYQLHDVERVCTQIFDELGFGRDLLQVDFELLRDDLLHAVFTERCHRIHLLGWSRAIPRSLTPAGTHPIGALEPPCGRPPSQASAIRTPCYITIPPSTFQTCPVT